ncbi:MULTISPECIES: hypothetical protein [unclassified Variovorax]|uniref:hypothetical protein n=1 Tax=unclassified Variovorax TaxID=663243 RepID=UPI0013186139|nr:MULTISPECIES: hypothetical protein [unclassified Variovorax]VTU42618.1 hypothetical protein H6P1_00236 [Variovorax sp. PBL-H6]VTU43802.1 hypothetical protein SRS16P1_00667 [Variovorax sp. SRS16]VTU43867.1 hypothetical protein E5P1_00660 [Variovorax sp. PBL-E5]
MKIVSRFAVAITAVMLSACQTPIIHGINKTLNAGTGLPANMQHRNIAAEVVLDEAWPGNYPFANRNILYTFGIESGSPEYDMRVVRLNIRQPEYGAWVSTGQKVWPTSAMVPDHLRALKAGDRVEVRQTGMYDVNKDFVAKGEGNIVVGVLCSKGDPGYDDCLKKLPRIGKFPGFGETGTLYPASVQEYGFTFTPKYDKDGKAIR